MPAETATDIISKKLFLSPAKTIFKHKVESDVTPPGASANEQTNIRLTVRVMAGMLAWLAGGRMILSSQTHPLAWAKGPSNP